MSSQTLRIARHLVASLPGVWFHGSSKLFDNFRLGSYKKSQQLGFGIHFTQDKEFASLYGPYIYSCSLSPVKVLDETKLYHLGDEEEAFARALHKGTGRRFWVDNNAFVVSLDVTSPARAERLLKQFGYDAVIYEAKYGSAAIGGMYVSAKASSVVMLDPDKIKILEVSKIQ
jgi:hypothetical protein